MSSEIEINGLRVLYDRSCETERPGATILFLHGWGGSSSSWEPNIRELRKYFDCVAIDLPGFGISDTPKNIRGVKEYAEFVRSFVEKLSINNYVMVGKSFGGRIALYYASKWPHDLSHLILVASAGVEKHGAWSNMKVSLASLGKLLVKNAFPSLESSARRAFYFVTRVKKDESDYKWEVKKLVTRADLSEVAGNINVPTLIIWGEDDNVLSVKVGKRLHSLIRGSRLVLIKGGHNAHIESANEFNSTVLDYLAHK
ncbi:MAG: alpha/beta hydrolase [Patescibacteria group bacterium]|nr:MAG: alpha/beta hydrolase [Patescibacteria group bacterium]